MAKDALCWKVDGLDFGKHHQPLDHVTLCVWRCFGFSVLHSAPQQKQSYNSGIKLIRLTSSRIYRRPSGSCRGEGQRGTQHSSRATAKTHHGLSDDSNHIAVILKKKQINKKKTHNKHKTLAFIFFNTWLSPLALWQIRFTVSAASPSGFFF